MIRFSPLRPTLLRLARLLPGIALAAALAAPALAECRGQDLIAALPGPERAALTPSGPYETGNFWQASKGDERLLLVGTYHLSDDRFGPLAASLAPPLAAAQALYVELSPQDEAALKGWLSGHPDAIFDQGGPSLRDKLGEADWQALSTALAARGTPAAAVLKMRPWVVAAMLEVPACMAGNAETLQNGLDHRLTALAEAQGLPIHGLEPFDTAIRVFASLSPADQLEMIRQALWTEPQAEDMAVTLTEAYFRGESPAFIAFARDLAIRTSGQSADEIDRQLKVMFATLLDGRNAAWIPVLEAAAAQGPTVAAFGALHLSGNKGVLNLLAQEGWTITPWAPGEAWPQ